MVFCLLAFVGFEAAAPLGEEAREPRRTIRRAVIWSAILIGVFYIFNYYAATVFFGPDRMKAEFYTFNDGDPWGCMADEVLPGIGGLLVTFAILNSSLANANAGATAATRSIFSMGRAGLLPGESSPRSIPTNKTPVNAVHVQAILGDRRRRRPRPVLVQGRDLTAGRSRRTSSSATCSGCCSPGCTWPSTSRRSATTARRRDEFNLLKHLMVPVLGVIAMIPAFLGVHRRR